MGLCAEAESNSGTESAMLTEPIAAMESDVLSQPSATALAEDLLVVVRAPTAVRELVAASDE